MREVEKSQALTGSFRENQILGPGPLALHAHTQPPCRCLGVAQKSPGCGARGAGARIIPFASSVILKKQLEFIEPQSMSREDDNIAFNSQGVVLRETADIRYPVSIQA